jgi:hypothetical protein
VDVLHDHQKNDLRHDLDVRHVRCNAMTDASRGHHLRVGDRHRTGFRDVVDLNLDASRDLRMSDLLDDRRDLNLDGMTDGNLYRRKSVPLDDLSLGANLDASRDLRMSDQLDDRHDLNLDVNLCHRMSDLLVDRKLDDVRHGLTMGDDLMTDASRVNRNCVLLDQKTVLMKDGNRGHHMSDRLDDRKMVATKDVNHRDVLVGHCNYALDDQNLDVSHANRNYARRDRSLGVMMDGNLCRRMNDLLGDLNSDDVRRDRKMAAMKDVNRGLRMSDRLDDLMTGVSRVNHKYVRRDLNLVAKMDGMNHHVM